MVNSWWDLKGGGERRRGGGGRTYLSLSPRAFYIAVKICKDLKYFLGKTEVLSLMVGFFILDSH